MNKYCLNIWNGLRPVLYFFSNPTLRVLLKNLEIQLVSITVLNPKVWNPIRIPPILYTTIRHTISRSNTKTIYRIERTFKVSQVDVLAILQKYVVFFFL